MQATFKTKCSFQSSKQSTQLYQFYKKTKYILIVMELTVKDKIYFQIHVIVTCKHLLLLLPIQLLRVGAMLTKTFLLLPDKTFFCSKLKEIGNMTCKGCLLTCKKGFSYGFTEFQSEHNLSCQNQITPFLEEKNVMLSLT